MMYDEPEMAATPEPNLRLPAAFDESEARRYENRRWWVRKGSQFLPIGFIDGTEPLEVYIPPGVWTIGAGPTTALRREIKIGQDGREVTVRAPCVRPGCLGVVEYRPSSPLPACEPFDASPPAARLCEECAP